jgi:hypothetical protein
MMYAPGSGGPFCRSASANLPVSDTHRRIAATPIVQCVAIEEARCPASTKMSLRMMPRFNSANRVADPELLEPVTRAAIANILQDARALGIELMLFETYRSQATQLELFNQGASKLRVVGVHHYGLACDLVKAVAGELPGRETLPSWESLRTITG